MQKDILYPDITPDQWSSVLRGGHEIRTTEFYRSGGAPIEQSTGRIVVRRQEVLSRSEIETSGEYPHHFRSEEFFEPNVERLEITDSVISRPISRTANNEIFNPYDDVHNPEDLSCYSRYRFSPSAFDDRLTVFKYRQDILRRIDTYPVIVIEGETGCGKTTQIPQFLLHDAVEKRQYANIVVTQPRRIAAISVTRQVCHANNWQFEPPGICGYQIGSEKRHCSPDTRLLYCTTGVVLRKLMSALKTRDGRQFGGGHFTHIILDEVHERDREMDLLMLLVKKYRAQFPTTKVIVMSATIQTKKTAEYFSTPGADKKSIPAPTLTIEGRTHEVKEWYLGDLCANFPEKIRIPRLDANEPQLSLECIDICVKTIENFSKMECGGPMGAVLVFLPGMQEIKNVYSALDRLQFIERITLHSEISVEEQRRVFLPVQAGYRKVILSTNIAESSITVPDVMYVIDFCLNKVLFTDHASSHLECLRLCWASKANCRQRAGRAGRVQDGRCYRLIPKTMYDELQEFPQPEILRASLCQTVLQVKLLDMGPPRSVLANAIDPPEENRIHKAVLICKEVQAMTTPQVDDTLDDTLSPEEKHQKTEEHSFDGDLTYLGEILANLPVDVRLGKLIIFGHIFGVVEPCVIIAASLTVKTFFWKTYNGEFEYHMTRLIYSNFQKSDPLTSLFAYEAMAHKSPGMLKERGIHRGRFEEVRYLVDDLKNRLSRFGIDFRDWTENLPSEKRDLRYNYRNFLIRLAIAAAFYPNYFLSSKTCDLELVRRELAGLSHLTTVQISNFPQTFGFFYHDKLVSTFQRCLYDPKSQHLRIFYEQSKAYVEFIDPLKPEDDISNCVYLALRMRMLRRECLPEIQPFNFMQCQQERERLVNEARERYRKMNRLTPTLIMITDDSLNPRSRAGSGQKPQVPVVRPALDVEPTAVLLSAGAGGRYALPGEMVQCAKIEITYVTSCCSFFAHFVQLNEVDSDSGRIRRALHERLQPAQIANLEPGTIYAALYPTNPFFGYQRVKFLEFLFNEEKARVVFIDIGETCDIDPQTMFDCPPSIIDFKYQAVRCRLSRTRENPAKFDLARSKLALNQFEVGEFGHQLKQFDAEIYSIVDGVVALVLLAKDKNSNIFSVGQNFIERDFAFFAEETPESQADHNVRIRKWGLHADSQADEAVGETVSYWPLRFASINVPSLAPFERPFLLRIANQPAELTWSCPVYGYGEQTRIKVASDSVNAIALEQYPALPSPNLLVAASAAKDDRSGGISLADTTLYPPKPGFAAIVSMLFSPAVELIKGNRQQDHPIGVLCGLGPDSSTMEAAFKDHDFYLTLDTKLTEADFVLINSVRQGINVMIDRANPVITQNATQFRRTQQDLIEAVITLLEKTERHVLEPEFPSVRYISWALKETAKQAPRNVLREISFKMHDGRSAENANFAFQGQNFVENAANHHGPHRLPAPSAMPRHATDEDVPLELSSTQELERNLHELELLIENAEEFESVRCMVCDQLIHNLRHLRVHMAASNHTRKVDLLRSRVAAETAGNRDVQERVDQERNRAAVEVPSTVRLMAAPFSAGRGASASGAGRGLGHFVQPQPQPQPQAKPQYFYQGDQSGNFEWPW